MNTPENVPLILCLLICLPLAVSAQNPSSNMLPYNQIPDYPDSYTAGNIVSRMIDGLGYRYYWATEGLTEPDLYYRPSEDSRNTAETLRHIWQLSETILNAAQNLPNVRSVDIPEVSFEELRESTLFNLQNAGRMLLGKSAEEVGDLKVMFSRGDQQSTFPFWHLINGQLTDAIYHTGQVVAFRRASGNPMDSRVNVFMGKTAQ